FLGLPLVSAMEMPKGALHTFYALPSGSLLSFFEAPKKPFDFKDQDSFDLHIALEVEDAELEAWVEKARAAGVATKGIIDHEVGRSTYFHDPNGYVIELTAPASAHERLNDPTSARKNLAHWQASKQPSVACVEPVLSPA